MLDGLKPALRSLGEIRADPLAVEEDGADYLSLLSLLHRKLDECVRTPFKRNS